MATLKRQIPERLGVERLERSSLGSDTAEITDVSSSGKGVDLSNLRIKERPSDISEDQAPVTGTGSTSPVGQLDFNRLQTTGKDLQLQQDTISSDNIRPEAQSFKIKAKSEDVFDKLADVIIPQASASDIDEEKVKRFIEHSKGLGKTREQTKQAYQKGLDQGIFDIQEEFKFIPNDPKDLVKPEVKKTAGQRGKDAFKRGILGPLGPIIDIARKGEFTEGKEVGKAISDTAKKFKFQSNVDDGVVESGFKFIGNLPANTAQIAGDVISIVSDPVGTAESVGDLATAGVESALNKGFSTDAGQGILRTAGVSEDKLEQIKTEGYFTEPEIRQIAETVGKEFDRLGDKGRIKELLTENPADVLLSFIGGLGVAKNVATSKKLTGLTAKIEQAQTLLNPIKIQADALKGANFVANTVVPAVAKAPFRVGASTLRGITPEKIGNTIANISPDTARVIKETPKSRIDSVLKQAQESVDNVGEVPSPFTIAGREAENVLKLIKKKKQGIGKSKGSELDKVSNKTIKTDDIQSDFNNLLKERFNLEVHPTDLKLKPIKGEVSSIGDSGIKELQELSDDLLEIFTQDNIKLKNLDSLVDKVQDTINFKKVPGKQDSKVVKTIKGFLEGNINKKLKESAGKGFTDANSEFRRLLELESDLEKLLGPKSSRIEGLMKSVFSPQGERTSRVFRDIKQEFGIDLINESKLAKFAMEAVGDTRSFNLLNALDLGPGFSQSKAALLQSALQGIFSPEKIAKGLAGKNRTIKIPQTN